MGPPPLSTFPLQSTGSAETASLCFEFLVAATDMARLVNVEREDDLARMAYLRAVVLEDGVPEGPGMAVALLHVEYLVANLVREFEWRPVDGEEVDLTEKMELSIVMKRPLRACVQRAGAE